METYIVAALQQLDCSPKEIRFYMANYKLGAASMTDIAKKARLQRSTAYIIADQLVVKHLISHDHRQYKKLLIAADPNSVIRMLEAKQRSVGKANIAIKTHLAELQSMYAASDILPKVTIYQGMAGLMPMWRDILGSPDEILLWTNQATERHVFDGKFHDQFITERVKKQISIRVLAVDNPEGRSIEGVDSDLLRETRILPAQTTFSAETYIYNNRVVILDFNTDIVGIMIDNPLIYQAQKAMFELCWQRPD